MSGLPTAEPRGESALSLSHAIPLFLKKNRIRFHRLAANLVDYTLTKKKIFEKFFFPSPR